VAFSAGGDGARTAREQVRNPPTQCDGDGLRSFTANKNHAPAEEAELRLRLRARCHPGCPGDMASAGCSRINVTWGDRWQRPRRTHPRTREVRAWLLLPVAFSAGGDEGRRLPKLPRNPTHVCAGEEYSLLDDGPRYGIRKFGPVIPLSE
jgi:hypothetical protein